MVTRKQKCESTVDCTRDNVVLVMDKKGCPLIKPGTCYRVKSKAMVRWETESEKFGFRLTLQNPLADKSEVRKHKSSPGSPAKSLHGKKGTRKFEITPDEGACKKHHTPLRPLNVTATLVVTDDRPDGRGDGPTTTSDDNGKTPRVPKAPRTRKAGASRRRTP